MTTKGYAMPSQKLVSIITPVWNEQLNILIFFKEIEKVFSESKYSFELIFVLDPSDDDTESEILKLINKHKNVKLLTMTRRFGQPQCTVAGLEYCLGDSAIVIDVDLQDPPSLIPTLLESWERGYKVVLAERKSRAGDTLLKLILSNLGYKFLNRYAEVPIPKNTGDYRLLDRSVIDELRNFPEKNSFLRGIISLIGYETHTVFFDRPPRKLGRSKYNQWIGSIKIALNGIIGFSTVLLSLSAVVGVALAGFFIIFILYFCYLILTASNIQIENTLLLGAIILMSVFNFMFLGIMGMYIARIYDEVKNRPKYLIKDKIGFTE